MELKDPIMNENSERLKSLDDSKLMDIVKNYRQYGYDMAFRNTAIAILKSRGVDEEDLKLTGNFDNKEYNRAEEIANSFSKNSKLSFLFYGIFFLTVILMRVISADSEFLARFLIILNPLSLVLFFIFLIISFINQNEFHEAIQKKLRSGDQLMYFILGMPFYIVMYFYYRQQMKEEMKLIE